jgi:hypothetical protein
LLDTFRRETGNTITTIRAVTDYLAALRRLGEHTLSEAVSGFMGTVATVKRVDLSTAVTQFISAREPKAKSKDGRRA